jgi:hypothetical protein
MRYCLFIIVSLFLFTSCENFFNQVIEVKVPEVNSRIVLDARVAAGDSVLTVFVSRSRGILDDSDYSYEAIILDSMYYVDFNGDSVLYVNNYFVGYDTVSNVKLELFKNGISLGQLPAKRPGYYEIPQLFSPTENDEYTLSAVADGFETVTTTSVIPVAPVIKSLEFTPGNGSGPFGDQVSSLDIVIDDVSQAADYYLVEVYTRYDTFAPYNPEFIMSNDPLTSANGDGGIMISDESFNGGQYNLRIGLYGDLTGIDSKVVLKSISKDHYLFLKSVQLYRNSNGNPFAEPVLLHSNVVNGYGLFAIWHQVEKAVE